MLSEACRHRLIWWCYPESSRCIRRYAGSRASPPPASRGAAAPQGSDAVVDLSSINGIMAIPNRTTYNVSKGGIDQLTRVMALALAGKGTRAAASPGRPCGGGPA
ncbi:MAG TPA: SDR family oxidoreductase [Geminicoccaceae bacterium]|nr:SDR family oxidoreductase [Geminicoccus sp.]HMU51776.1 SDR family oxidoreductase [Geminicoccaceae bacterium]